MKLTMWVFMLVCNLIIPAVVIWYGMRFKKNPPREVNTLFGYRTVMSMKNQDTWDFAHQVCGRLWWKAGWMTLAPAVLCWAVSLWHCPYTQGMLCVWFVVPAVLEIVVYAATYGVVERALRKNFDRDGNRR